MRSDPGRMSLDRVFDAPIAAVYDAFTDPEKVRRWWAPAGWCTPSVEIDLRVGGRYRFGMHEIEGGSGLPEDLMYVHGTYLSIVPGELVEFTYICEGTGAGDRWHDFELVGHETRVRISFVSVGDAQTRVTIEHSGFPTRDGCEAHIGGWTSNNDELARYLCENA